jgi:hypothetical protein
VVGPSSCGKSTFIKNLLENAKITFNPPPKHIFWHYGEIIPSEKLPDVKYKKGLPTSESIPVQSVVILDDLMIEAANSALVTQLFTRVAHHRECAIIYITQNLYHQSSQNRTRNLNVHYLILFKSVRDTTIIQTLARQMYPGKSNFLIEAYKDATSKPYGYLFIDFHTETPDYLRVRTNIILGDEIIVYINNNDYDNLYKDDDTSI